LNEVNDRCQDDDEYCRIENPWTGRRDSLKSEDGIKSHHKIDKTVNMVLNALCHRKASDWKDQ
jgi:hypothetical protein